MANVNTESSVSNLARSLQSLPGQRKAREEQATAQNDIFAGQRRRVESTQAALSGLGQLRSAESQLQTAARDVAKIDTSKAADTENAVKRFTESFNRTRAAAADNSVAREGRADQAARNVERAVSGAGTERLAKIGINLQKDGSLQVDSKKLQEALQNNPDNVSKTLKEVATRTEAATSRDVGQDGNSGRLTSRISTVNAEAQQQEQQRSDALQQVQQLQKRFEEPLNNATGNAIANYRKTQLV